MEQTLPSLHVTESNYIKHQKLPCTIHQDVK